LKGEGEGGGEEEGVGAVHDCVEGSDHEGEKRVVCC
jgi:hypothetical protein